MPVVRISCVKAHLKIHAGHIGDKMNPRVHMQLGQDGQDWFSPIVEDGGHEPHWKDDAFHDFEFPAVHHHLHIKVRNVHLGQDHHLGEADVLFASLHEHHHGHHEVKIDLHHEGAEVGHLVVKYHVM